MRLRTHSASGWWSVYHTFSILVYASHKYCCNTSRLASPDEKRRESWNCYSRLQNQSILRIICFADQIFVSTEENRSTCNLSALFSRDLIHFPFRSLITCLDSGMQYTTGSERKEREREKHIDVLVAGLSTHRRDICVSVCGWKREWEKE